MGMEHLDPRIYDIIPRQNGWTQFTNTLAWGRWTHPFRRLLFAYFFGSGGVDQLPYPAGTAPFEPELWRDQLRQEERKKLVDKIETQTEREVEGRHKETFEVWYDIALLRYEWW